MRKGLLTLFAVALLVQASVLAQPQPQDTPTYKLTGTRIAFAQDVKIEGDQEVTDAVVVVGGNVTIAGRVRDGVVVVGGDLQLLPTADVRGDVVLVGGQLIRETGSQMTGNVNYVSFGDWTR